MEQQQFNAPRFIKSGKQLDQKALELFKQLVASGKRYDEIAVIFDSMGYVSISGYSLTGSLISNWALKNGLRVKSKSKNPRHTKVKENEQKPTEDLKVLILNDPNISNQKKLELLGVMLKD